MCRRVLLLFIFVYFLLALHAQHITLKFNNAKLEKVLSSITEQTDFTFAYSSSIVNLDDKITINTTNTDLPTVLQQIFSNTDIAFEIGVEKIYLTKKEDKTSSIKPPEKIQISGYITDESGESLVAATIVEKGTTNGTVTQRNGSYTLEVAPDASIVVNYLGYFSKEVQITDQTVVNIKLAEDNNILNELVVTALGIEKKEESLSYSAQKVGGVDLIRSKENNFVNSLAGKVSNVQISRNSSGLGSSSRVLIRGSRSTSKNNQPLYVIDGIPILNTSSEQALTAIGGIANAGNRDGGDGISNLNPEDIASITILKGASAAALYGSSGGNGVILINSQDGTNGPCKVRISSEITFDTPILLPEFQNSYGHVEGTGDSWGEKSNLTDYNNLNNFFQTGVSLINSIVLTTGNEKIRNYFSYANTKSIGTIENSKFDKHNFNLRTTTGFFKNRLTLDANMNFIVQNIENKPVSGGYYMNPLVGLYTFPRGKDLNEYKESFEVYNKDRAMHVQNWYTDINDGFEQNPYWLTNRVLSTDTRYRGILLLSANLKINDWLTIQGKGGGDYINDKFRQKMYASTSNSLAGENGRYIDFTFCETMLYGATMLKINKKWDNLELQIDAGATIKHISTNKLRYDSQTASLYFPNVFSIANIQMNSDAYIDEAIYKEQTQSVFSSVVVGFKQQLYLDITARNEWSSTLAYTKSKDTGFFYPSVGGSWIMNKTLDLPGWISFAKLRSAWGKVGNALPPTASLIQSKIMPGINNVQVNYTKAEDLKPEMSTSYEIGTELNFLQHRIGADITLYKTNTKNQMFTLPTIAGTDENKSYNVNSGNIQNKGIEVTLSFVPVLSKNFKWSNAINYSINRNVVLELHEDLLEYRYNEEDISSTYSMILRKGDSFGDIYGTGFRRDEAGNILYDEAGLPIASESSNSVKVGNCNPDFLLGWSHEFSYKRLSLYFLLDGRFGGKILSQTQAELDLRGVTKATGDARDRGYVELEGTKVTDVKGFYEQVGGRSGITEYYMYDATNIRLRELAVSYDLPAEWFMNTNYIAGLRLTLSGRNLFFLYNKVPFDPDAVLSTNNNNQGVHVFGTPMTQSIGFNVRIRF